MGFFAQMLRLGSALIWRPLQGEFDPIGARCGG